MNINIIPDSMKGAAPLRVCSRARAQHADHFPTELVEQQQQHARRMIEARHAVVHIRRKMMIISIKRLLEKKSGRKMLSESTLSLLVKRVEFILFESAYSLEDYSDLSTLKERIIAIARKALLDSH